MHLWLKRRRYLALLSAISSVASLSRETMTASMHYVWGNPQENQYTLSNGTPSPGLNRYGDLSPTYLGGTAPEWHFDFHVDHVDQLIEYDSTTSETIILNPRLP
jgi:hypothetical protein